MLFNEPKLLKFADALLKLRRYESFSALQRAEIAEIQRSTCTVRDAIRGFSALQRAEIAEIAVQRAASAGRDEFQCSSTSRNC